MNNNKLILFVVMIISFLPSTVCLSQGQSRSLFSEQDFIVQDVDSINYDKTQIVFAENIEGFFDKLQRLDSLKQGKLNIVHIGDSHIQADFLTNEIREKLQTRFGNAGLGFAFPYRLAKTNGNAWVKYSSNVDWESYRNIFPVKQAKVGLSGIGLSTQDKNAVIELKVTNSRYGFSSVKVFTPDNAKNYQIGISDTPIKIESSETKSKTHLIRSGQSLSTIAKSYGTSINELKRLNKLKTNTIVAGKSLVVPSLEKKAQIVATDKFKALEGDRLKGYYQYTLDKPVEQIFFYSNSETSLYELNGLVLLNDQPGVVYHTIGVNGARFSDFTKYDLFFEQLTGLEPDLLIVSMGTNESFDRISASDFIAEVNYFLDKVHREIPGVEVLITTPSPSYFSKTTPNTKVSELSDALFINALDRHYALWDLYHSLGGILALPALREQQMLAKDLVHYTVKGYQYSGDLFYRALLQSFERHNKQEHVQQSTVSNEAI